MITENGNYAPDHIQDHQERNQAAKYYCGAVCEIEKPPHLRAFSDLSLRCLFVAGSRLDVFRALNRSTNQF
jgi:hypothetical protein